MGAKNNMSALVHPADGLYATSRARLDELGACQAGQRTFSDAAERISAADVGPLDDVRITWGLLTAIMVAGPCLGWLIDTMHEQGRITGEEHAEADRAYWNSNWDTAAGRRGVAKGVMDLLLVRAKREGLVAS